MKELEDIQDQYNVSLETSRGWNKLIFQLLTDITKTLTAFSVPLENLYIQQIKSKFGELRFYYHLDCDLPLVLYMIDKLVNEAEINSATICEKCGNPGNKKEIKNWLITLCNQCLFVHNCP